MSAILDKIRAAEAKNMEPVECPAWGVTIYLRPITLAARAKLAKHVEDHGDDDVQAAAFIIQHCACDETGAPVFADLSIDDVLNLDAATLGLISDAATKLNGMGEDAVGDAEKNS